MPLRRPRPATFGNCSYDFPGGDIHDVDSVACQTRQLLAAGSPGRPGEPFPVGDRMAPVGIGAHKFISAVGVVVNGCGVWHAVVENLRAVRREPHPALIVSPRIGDLAAIGPVRHITNRSQSPCPVGAL